jgi:hypothetical protein
MPNASWVSSFPIQCARDIQYQRSPCFFFLTFLLLRMTPLTASSLGPRFDNLFVSFLDDAVVSTFVSDTSPALSFSWSSSFAPLMRSYSSVSFQALWLYVKVWHKSAQFLPAHIRSTACEMFFSFEMTITWFVGYNRLTVPTNC